jgi:hypothetical protein
MRWRRARPGLFAIHARGSLNKSPSSAIVIPKRDSIAQQRKQVLPSIDEFAAVQPGAPVDTGSPVDAGSIIFVDPRSLFPAPVHSPLEGRSTIECIPAQHHSLLRLDYLELACPSSHCELREM